MTGFTFAFPQAGELLLDCPQRCDGLIVGCRQIRSWLGVGAGRAEGRRIGLLSDCGALTSFGYRMTKPLELAIHCGRPRSQGLDLTLEPDELLTSIRLRPDGRNVGTFGIARLHYRKDQLVVQHAHGFVAQTAADLGTLGLLAVLALAGAWFVSASRTTGLERHPERREGAPLWWDADRVAMTALALSAIVFGLHSAIDWTWFVPGPAVMAIAIAGYVAGRGPAPPCGDPA